MWIDWKGYWYKCLSRLPRIVSPITLRQKKKIIVKFSIRKDAKSALCNKNKNKNFNPRSIDLDSNKVFINESLCCYYKFLWSKCKKFGLINGSKLFVQAMVELNLELNQREQSLKSNISRICRNYFQIAIVSLISSLFCKY